MPSRPGNGPAEASSAESSWSKIKKFVILWLKLTWLDLIFLAPIHFTRTFPVTFDKSGDIVFPQWAYPERGWIISPLLSGIISIGGPITIYLLAQFRLKSAWDASNAIVGTVWAVILGSLFHTVIKQLIGGFRPYFLDVCMPDISLAKLPGHNQTGLDGSGFQQIMYTTDICTQPSKLKLKLAITSFPSGHSTTGFAGFGFLFLWLNAKLKVWADHKPAFWKLTLTMVPLLAAVMMACSLTIDAAHNWYDIAFGSLIGCVVAFAAYRTSYAAVWDWRYNHLPLQQREAFRYGLEGDREYEGQTLASSAGWGAVNKKAWPHEGLSSAASSAVFARRMSGIQQVDDADVNASGQTATQRRVPPADDMV